MEDIVIVAVARTAVGKFGGTLSRTPATELGAAVIVDGLWDVYNQYHVGISAENVARKQGDPIV